MSDTSLRPLAIGDRLRDNDPRMHGRVLLVARVSDDCVYLNANRREILVARRRIHLDGKPRRSGWSRVP